MSDYRFEPLGGGIELCVSREHTFGSDALLLSVFARPKRRERAMDLCSGCGVIPMLWISRPDAPAELSALDIQPEAVALMRRTAEKNGLETRFSPREGDLRELRAADHAAFDLVTCNPPYRQAGAGKESESEAERIARHETLCTLEDVIRAAAHLLRFGGRFCLCQLPERLVDVLALMRLHGIEPKRLQFVQQRADTPPWLVLVEGKRGAKPHLTVEAPVLMERDRPRYPLDE